jgi:murein L,D-transpeptidase YafK
MKLIRFSLLSTALATTLALVGCTEEGTLPRSGRHYVPISIETQELMREKEMRTHAPMLIRAFKQESEIEVWKQASSGKMELLKTYPMCRWSGQLGPKVREGDRQVPEGFYNITQGQMNPNSSFYLSFNVGYPNEVDRQLGRTGSHIMVHGDCSSMGCFAMTDGQIADIYALTRESFAGGQKSIQMQSFPFRMTPENLAKFRNDPNIAFWRTLKEGNDHFMVTQKETRVAACGGRYAFGTEPGSCAPDPAIADTRAAVASRMRSDDIKVAELVSTGKPAVKRVYKDGDMHPVFRRTLMAEHSKPVGTTRNGISQQDAISIGAVELPVERYKSQKAKGQSSSQIAEVVHVERMNAEFAKAEGTKAEPAKVEPAKFEPGKVEPAKVEPSRPTTAVASAPAPTRQGAPAPAVAAAVAATPATPVAALTIEPKERSVFQRMLGTVGLSNEANPATTDAAKVEEVAPRAVTVPLPQRRQVGTAPGAVAGPVSAIVSSVP